MSRLSSVSKRKDIKLESYFSDLQHFLQICKTGFSACPVLFCPHNKEIFNNARPNSISEIKG